MGDIEIGGVERVAVLGLGIAIDFRSGLSEEVVEAVLVRLSFLGEVVLVGHP